MGEWLEGQEANRTRDIGQILSPTGLELGLRDSLVFGTRAEGAWGASLEGHFCCMHTAPGKPVCRE